MADDFHVGHYRSTWDYGLGRGMITLVLADGREQVLDKLDAITFMALNDLLRNERPVVWNPTSHTVSSLSEMVGEGEIR